MMLARGMVMMITALALYPREATAQKAACADVSGGDGVVNIEGRHEASILRSVAF